MIKGHLVLLFLFGFFMLVLPIYPGSSTIDFGGHVDPSLVYLFLFLITGTTRSKILMAIGMLVFYLILSDSFAYIELVSKLLVSYFFIRYVQGFFWSNLKNDFLLSVIFLVLFYLLNFLIYWISFDVGILEFFSFIALPLVYNIFVSTILLIIIKYPSWPKVNDLTYQS